MRGSDVPLVGEEPGGVVRGSDVPLVGEEPGGVVRGSDVPLIGEAACALCDGEDGGRTGAVGPLGGRPAGPPTGAGRAGTGLGAVTRGAFDRDGWRDIGTSRSDG